MKKVLIGLNAFNCKSKISNANWENSSKEAVYVENGDTIALKSSFIDSRNRVTGNINIDQNTTIELSYMFYYINRGGTSNLSKLPTTLFPNRQQLAMEYYNNGTENSNNPSSAFVPETSLPNGVGGITIPVVNPTDKTPANLAPLVESIYHCYSDQSISTWLNNTKSVVSFSAMVVGQQYYIQSLGDISIQEWQNVGAVPVPYIGMVFKCTTPPSRNIPIISAANAVVNSTYKIISLGNNDTNWVSLNNTLTNPTINTFFQCLTPYEHITPIADHTQLNIVGQTYTILESNGYDFSSIGGPALPANTNSAISLNTQAQEDTWYSFISLTPKLTDGTILVNYVPYFGNIEPTLATQFVSLAPAQNVMSIPIPTTDISLINSNMTIIVSNQGLIDWDLLGYNSPAGHITDIATALVNTTYRIIDVGGRWGVRNQFYQSSLFSNVVGNLTKLTAPYSPVQYPFPIYTLNQLGPLWNGEYFILQTDDYGNDTAWQSYFDIISGEQTYFSGRILIAKNLINPMPALNPNITLKWIQIKYIPIGTTIATNNPNFDENMEIIINIMGGQNVGAEEIFTTTKMLSDTDLLNLHFTGIFDLPDCTFSFIAPKNMLEVYQLQVPFTFTTTNTYPVNATRDTTWVASLVPTDRIIQIENYATAISFTTTGNLPLSTSVLNASIFFVPNPSGTIQEGDDDQVVVPYNLTDINHIKANNPVGFTNTIDANFPDGLPYLLSYCAPKNIDGSTTYNTEIEDPGEIKPFIKKWKMVIKKGTYTPDYLAQIITRGMSIQRQKIQSTLTTTSSNRGGKFMGTPIQGINSQMYKSNDFSWIKNQSTNVLYGPDSVNFLVNQPYYGFTIPNCEQGAFPSPNQVPINIQSTGAGDIDINRYNPATEPQPYPSDGSYQPNLMFNPKNRNILPGYNGNLTTLEQVPVNPKYTVLDFNNPDSTIQDDTPFIYRPNAFTQYNSLDKTKAKVRLSYNDFNLSNFNNIADFGKVSDGNIKNIEMMYRPLLSDLDSSYFYKVQFNNKLPITKDYAIKPVISVPVVMLPSEPIWSGGSIAHGQVNNTATYSAPIEIGTPLVGAPLMSLTYNNENNQLFQFTYMHTPIYAKPTAQSESVQEVVGMYPCSINSLQPPVNGANLLLLDNTTTDCINGKIIWLQRANEITATSIYGIPVADFASNVVFQFFYSVNFPNTYNGVGNIPSFTNTATQEIISFNLGDTLLIKGSLLNGIDGLNDMSITTTTPTPSHPGGVIILGTPSPQFYSTGLTDYNGVMQLAQQSGIILYDMKATKADGSSTPFWENLGFNVREITYKNDYPLTFEKFSSLTTKGFLGTSNIFDPETLSSGTTEQSYLSYTDSLNMLGWYSQASIGTLYPDTKALLNQYFPNWIEGQQQNDLGDEKSIQTQGNFTLQKKILYSLVETTIPVSAENTFSDNEETGHYLISIEGYGGTYLLTDLDKLSVKSLVSSYYTSPNAFITNTLEDTALYEHIGTPMKIQNFKIRILNAFTGEEVENLGPNSSIYLEITKTLNKNNILNITSSN